MAIVNIANLTGLINYQLRGKAAQFEQLDLLAVQFQNLVFGVGQTDKRQFFFLPVFLKRPGIFRPGNHYFRIQLDEFLIILAQLRHVRAAERSKKSAVKNHHHVLFVEIVGKRHSFTVEIVQRKIWRLNI